MAVALPRKRLHNGCWQRLLKLEKKMEVPASQFPQSTQIESDAGPQLNSTEIAHPGSLIEKQTTNPETYPLTLNALVLTAIREPVANR